MEDVEIMGGLGVMGVMGELGNTKRKSPRPIGKPI